MATRRTPGKIPHPWELLRTASLAWRLFRDRRVPLVLKLIPVAAVLYALAPVDIVPDLVPVAGQMDDLAILLSGLQLFIRLCPSDVVARHQGQDKVTWNQDRADVIDGEWRYVDED